MAILQHSHPSGAALASRGSSADRPAEPGAPRPLNLRLVTGAGLAGVAITAFVLRALLAARQSAYMDEGAMILAGRTLLEKRSSYADVLDWAYGSYLWPLIAGAADMAGGLTLVRLVTALLGAMMTVATALTAAALAPRSLSEPRRWSAALLAGLVMALFPTAVALGRFGSYDSLAGAAFMGGVALLAFHRRNGGRLRLPAAALLLFVAFLAKYMVAVFFPVVCMYLLLSPRRRRAWLRNVALFVAPLSLACAAYFIAFHDALIELLDFSTGYTDLRSTNLWREYGYERWEVWLLGLVAVFGLRRADRFGRAVAVGGVGVIAAFQAAGRADFDFWKHTVYVVFFLAPLAGLALASLADGLVHMALAGFGWRAATGTERVVAVAGGVALIALQAQMWPHPAIWGRPLLAVFVLAPLAALALAPAAAARLGPLGTAGRRIGWRATVAALSTGVALPLLLVLTLVRSNENVTFYPNLNPSLGAIMEATNGARRVLADDSILRYYLHTSLPYQRVTDPFFITYKGQEDLAGYRLAITDRYFDVIVLDGGIGPLGQRIRGELGPLIGKHYDRVYFGQPKTGTLVEVYKAREDAPSLESTTDDVDGPGVTYFDEEDLHGWGGHPEGAELQPEQGVERSRERLWKGHASLRFTADPKLTLVGVRVEGPVSKVELTLYVNAADGEDPELRVGMIGFDKDWQWHDDGFKQVIPTGRWNRITWELQQPGEYHEIGLKLPDGSRKTVYLGRVEVTP